MRAFDHIAVRSTDDAIAALRDGQPTGAAQTPTEPANKLIAGGTDLLTLMKADLIAPARLIDVKPIRSLRYIQLEEDGAVRIGAGATLADIERHAELAERLPILRQAVRDAATPQLRAMATVGGNLLQRNRCWYFRGPYNCWLKGGAECFAREGENKYQAIFDESPCVAVHPSDLAPALIALDATVAIEGQQGARTVSVADLLQPPSDDTRIEHRLDADELIVAFDIPAQAPHTHGVYLKMMDRQAWAFALVSAAAQVTLRSGKVRQARLVLGGVANTPRRITAAESLLIGQPLTPALAAQVAEAAVADAMPLAHNRYKVALARELVRRALLLAAGMEF
ncbi:MAG TPA: xanthine dehydrogenase family protein subunit M [Ktedonobacterales bacterium]|nr:xanthine dehydrogenase family protein subunit M [Ktedonobacterales bacterium]